MRTGKELIKEDTERPNVRGEGIGLKIENFRTHVQRSTANGGGHVGVLEDGGETEVANFRSTIMEEDIFGLDIAVHNFLRMEIVHCIENLDKNFFDGGFRLRIFYEMSKIAIITEFENEVNVFIVEFKIVESDDVRMFDGFEEEDFIVKFFLKGW